jgi:putative transposase
MDLCSRRVVGWTVADHMRSSLVSDPLQQAIATRRNTQGIIVHSDRGSQYGSKAFRKLLQTAGMVQSMSAKANPYHNAWSESVIGTLKAEMLRDGHFITLADARLEIGDYIDTYYNTQRLHCFAALTLRAAFGWPSSLRFGSSVNYLPPATFEAKLLSAA